AELTAGFRPEEIAQAEAQLEQYRANLRLLREGPRRQTIAAADARLTAANAELNLAQQTFERTQRLFRQGASTQEEMDRTTERLKAATSMAVVRELELNELREGTRPEELRQAEARVTEAEQLL